MHKSPMRKTRLTRNPPKGGFFVASTPTSTASFYMATPVKRPAFQPPMPGLVMSKKAAAEAGSGKGTKNDHDKLRMDLIAPEFEEALAQLLTIGASIYGDDNYLNGMSYRRCIAAQKRHLKAFAAGETYDAETGAHHQTCVAFYSQALLLYDMYGYGTDDRPQRFTRR